MGLETMNEALRLTRAGRLSEATALLRGASPAGAEPGAASRRDRARGDDRAPEETPGDASRRFVKSRYAGPAGARDYWLYTPRSGADGAAGLVLMLHGCTQSPSDFAAGTAMNALADRYGFLVAYPGQSRRANANRCWNWFEPAHQKRDAGEPAIIAGLAERLARDHEIAPDRIFIAGLSSGGAAALVAANLYPDVFAGVGVHSGLAQSAANSVASAFAAMERGAPGQASEPAGPPVIIFHGDADMTVNVANADAIVEAALSPYPVTIMSAAEGEENGRAFTRTTHSAPDGRVRCEIWRLRGGGHASSGGDARGSYADAAGPSASREMARFFFGEAPAPDARGTARPRRSLLSFTSARKSASRPSSEDR